jgi:hypothetical protein
MKKILLAILLFLGAYGYLFSQGTSNTELEKAYSEFQKYPEVQVRFAIPKSMSMEQLTILVSIDKIKNDTVFAYLNKKQFERFLRHNIPFSFIPKKIIESKSIKATKGIWEWDTYPTYTEYLAMMDSLVYFYPQLCKLVEIGQTTNGRKLLCLRITDNVNEKEAEPEFFYSSSIHGDEVTGYVLMLRLAYYLLSNYGINDFTTQLVDNIDIYINPLANPDGTFYGGNNSVASAIRGNTNGVDLNRNFPDPSHGEHPDDEVWQTETQAMMNFMSQHHFIMSANFHGGIELVNYPWDCWSKRHADDAWFYSISKEYADSAQHYGPANYFTGIDGSGFTNGFDWTQIFGGRQDYITYFHHGRETTIEISEIKMPEPSSMPTFWESNYRSLLHYMEQVTFGIRGIVTDSLTGEPLKAKVEIVDHDIDHSYIYSDSVHGDYYRPVADGLYTLKYSAPGYIDKEISNIAAYERQANIVTVLLNKESQLEYKSFVQTLFTDQITVQFPKDIAFTGSIDLYSTNGQLIKKYQISNPANNKLILQVNDVVPGLYFLKYSLSNKQVVSKVAKLNR